MKIGEGRGIPITMVMGATVVVMMMFVADGADKNDVFSPCSDAKVQKSDGFTFGLAFSTKESFFFNQTQLSPCDQRLSLSSKNAQLALFRPKVDEISFLTINSSAFNPVYICFYFISLAYLNSRLLWAFFVRTKLILLRHAYTSHN
jgi:hypothetical protein